MFDGADLLVCRKVLVERGIRMKSLYKKGMTVEEIGAAADQMWDKLHEVDLYLNEKGRHAKEAHFIIEQSCIFAKSKEDLADEIRRTAADRQSDDKVMKKLENFIRKYLEE